MLKILLYDLETSPNLSWVWGQWEQNVIQHNRQSHMLCFSYKWLGEDKVYSVALPDFALYKKDKENDRFVAKAAHKLFDEADIIVAHNGDSFDIRKTNAYFIENGLKPPSPYKTVDTKKIAKRVFYFNSNKLNDIGEYLGLGKKLETGGFELWKGCMAGDMKAWKKMVAYNKQDIVLLEKVYNKLLPWIPNHPKVNTDYDGCPNCGSQRSQKRGFTHNRKGQKYQCMDCGKWFTAKII